MPNLDKLLSKWLKGSKPPGTLYREFSRMNLLYPSFGPGRINQTKFISSFNSTKTPDYVKKYILYSFFDSKASEKISREILRSQTQVVPLKVVFYRGGLHLFDQNRNKIITSSNIRKDLYSPNYLSARVRPLAAGALTDVGTFKLYTWIKKVYVYLFYLGRVIAALARKYLTYLYAGYDEEDKKIEDDSRVIKGLVKDMDYIPILREFKDSRDFILPIVEMMENGELEVQFDKLYKRIDDLIESLEIFDDFYYNCGATVDENIREILWIADNVRDIIAEIIELLKTADFSKINTENFRVNYVVPEFQSDYMIKRVKTMSTDDLMIKLSRLQEDAWFI